ncbi:MAG: hypothetical protein KBS81_10325 [Spirochaetales bacterium]|nr:hypothetical protein [Candidatus Physcosoma equi]
MDSQALTAVHNGRPCRLSEMTVGNTIFTVVSVQSDSASETAYEKFRKRILEDVGEKANTKHLRR